MIITEQRDFTGTAAGVQKTVSASSVHMGEADVQTSTYSSDSRSSAAQSSFKSMSEASMSEASMSGASMSAMMAKSMVSMSSSSQMMEMSIQSHVKASSSLSARTTGVKRGEIA